MTVFAIVLLISDDVDSYLSKNLPVFMPISLILLTAVVTALLANTRRWLLPSSVPTNLGNVSWIENELYQRARRYTIEANIVLVLMFLVVIGAAIVFFKASSFAYDDLRILFFKEVPKIDLGNKVASAAVQEQIKALFKDATASQAAWVPLLAVTALRIGVIAVASFLTYTLIRIYRYNIRLSSFYISRADALIMERDKRLPRVKHELLPVLMDANFDFGGDQVSLAQSFAELIAALNPRRSNRTSGESRPRSSKKKGPSVGSPE